VIKHFFSKGISKIFDIIFKTFLTIQKFVHIMTNKTKNIIFQISISPRPHGPYLDRVSDFFTTQDWSDIELHKSQ